MKGERMTQTIQQLASRYGVTADRIREQFARNAAGLRQMQGKAERTGRRVNGYTAEQLGTLAASMEARAAEGL
jgi:hypothetical protein